MYTLCMVFPVDNTCARDTTLSSRSGGLMPLESPFLEIMNGWRSTYNCWFEWLRIGNRSTVDKIIPDGDLMDDLISRNGAAGVNM